MWRGRRPDRAVLGAVLILATGCQWQRVGSEVEPDPSVVLPQLFDATALYRQMGFLASGAPLPYVATFRYLATESRDTTLAVFGLSLTNSALAFQRGDDGFEARYSVELSMRREGRVLARVNSEEQVRVASREEARRADESVIFQQQLRLAPGDYEAVVSIRDEGTGTVGRVEQAIRIPGLADPGVSAPIPVYQAGARTSLQEAPRILLNPRATVPFGLDTLRLYVEAYGVPPGSPATIGLVGPEGTTPLRRTTELAGTLEVTTAVVRFLPDELPVGQLRVTVAVEGRPDTSSLRALVSFSDQWAITNFDEILALLRYFGQDRAISEMRNAEPTRRAELWRDFWKATDPNPLTPQNEALDLYFRRVAEANDRFREAGEPGWLSDRGEVFITLGEPDEVFDQSSDLQGPVRIIRWNYLTDRLTLDFVDDTGFGRFRLTPASRSNYQRVLNMVRGRG